MKTFKPWDRRIRFTSEQEAWLKSLPKHARKQALRRMTAKVRAKQSEAYDRTKLRASGLWNEDAARQRSRVTVQRIVRNADGSETLVPVTRRS